MRPAFIAFSALLLTAGPGITADMPTKTPSSITPVSWTGCYVGANGGEGWIADNGNTFNNGGVAIPLGTGSATGSAFGGQFGCDYQVNSNWIVGVRGMWDGTNIKNSVAGVVPPVPVNAVQLNSQTTSFATAVARVGYDMLPTFMVYGVGGVAFVKNQYTGMFSFAGAPFIPAAGGSEAPTGWVAGAGVSWMFAPAWDVWIEYDYMGFGNRTVNLPAIPPFTIPSSLSLSQHVESLLVGIDFRFTNWVTGQYGIR
jgi:outer membrane immunogenic protein